MIELPEDRCARHRVFMAIDGAFKEGNFDALRLALGGSPRWFDEPMPQELGLGHPLEYAIYWSPLEFIGRLIRAGANPKYADDGGFPALFAALSTDRSDRPDIIRLLIASGVDVDQRGLNDWTPLHYAVNRRNPDAIGALLAAGADPSLRTRIDSCETALEEGERMGHEEEVAAIRRMLG